LKRRFNSFDVGKLEFVNSIPNFAVELANSITTTIVATYFPTKILK
jgi:hypothetical protein